VIQLSKSLNHALATHNQVDSFFENINHNDCKGAFTLTLFEMTITDCPGFHVLHCTVTISFLAFSLLKRPKRKKTKKRARLFIDGHFEVILCSCHFDNFSFYIDYKHNFSNFIVIYDQFKFVSDPSSNIREVNDVIAKG
jgi:hypothetical protein